MKYLFVFSRDFLGGNNVRPGAQIETLPTLQMDVFRYYLCHKAEVMDQDVLVFVPEVKGDLGVLTTLVALLKMEEVGLVHLTGTG